MRNAAALYGLVAAGGVIGSLLRWGVALVLPVETGALPWATFLANTTGCFAIGLYAALAGPDGRLSVSPRTRQFVMTGLCGGYTTFSAFGLETYVLAQADAGATALLHVGLSVASWLAAVWLGDFLAGRLGTWRS